MKVVLKGYDVFIGADVGTNNYTINIPVLKFFKSYNIKKNPLASLENKAAEIIEEKLKNEIRSVS